MGRLLPAERVTDYSAEYASVTLFGTARIVTDPAEARSVLQRQLQKYFPHKQPGRDYQPQFSTSYACKSFDAGLYGDCHNASGLGHWPSSKTYREVITVYVSD